MTLSDRQSQLSAQRADLERQLAAIAAQGDPIRAQIAALDTRQGLLAELLADPDVNPVPTSEPTAAA
jgi:cell division protein FtsB